MTIHTIRTISTTTGLMEPGQIDVEIIEPFNRDGFWFLRYVNADSGAWEDIEVSHVSSITNP